MTWEGKTMIAGIATNALLTQLIMELKSGSIRRCEALGMTMEEIQALNRLSIEFALPDQHAGIHSDRVHQPRQSQNADGTGAAGTAARSADRSCAGAGWFY